MKTINSQKIGKHTLIEKELHGDYVVFLMRGRTQVAVFDSFAEAMQKRCEWDETFVSDVSSKSESVIYHFNKPFNSLNEMFSEIDQQAK